MKLRILLLVIIIFCACKEDKKTAQNTIAGNFKATSPFKKIHVPYEEVLIDPAKDTTVIFKSGDFLDIPKNAFVDQSGNQIRTPVKLKFRSFSNSLDILSSGIPMDYEKNGSNYIFESAAMCEITPEDSSIKIAPNKEIGVGLATTIQDDENFNMYELNNQGVWEDREKDSLIIKNKPLPVSEKDSTKGDSNIQKSFEKKIAAINKKIKQLEKPIQPLKRKGGDFYIEVDVSKRKGLKEFDIFNNVKFKLLDRRSYKKEEISGYEWYDVKLKRVAKKDFYLLTFKGHDANFSKIEKSFNVLPCYDNEDYEKASNKFDTLMSEYENELKRIEEEKERQRIAFEKAKLEEEKAQIAREKEAAVKRGLSVEDYRKEIERENRISETNNNVYRYFRISNFGIYNCDRFFDPKDETITLFLNIKNVENQFNKLYMVDAERNRVLNISNQAAAKFLKEGAFHIVGVHHSGNIGYAKNLNFNQLEIIDQSVNLELNIVEETTLDDLKAYLQ